jgi:signal transduction histidine kinase
VGEGRLLVQVGESLQGVQAARRALLLGVAVAIPLALLAAAGGGWLLARRALRPVDVLTRAARHITAEELHHRLPDYPANDELGRLTRTLNEMIARLEDSFDQVRRFTADASHELRTPLTVLRGELEVALRAVRSPEEYQRVLASGMEEVRRMERLVDNLLTLARADAGEAQLKWTEVDMTDLVREVVTQGMVLARAKEVALTLEMADEGLRVRGDADRLRELLLHLLDNAVKYTPSGGRVTVRAEVSSVEVCSVPVRASRPPDGGTTNVTRHSSLVTLSVTDTGPGIAPEHLPRIFDRFYRVDKARSRELGGSGLGLAIGRWIAEAHGGRLEVTSGVGRGSTFTVLLPQH